jgi:hypothetical protein
VSFDCIYWGYVVIVCSRGFGHQVLLYVVYIMKLTNSMEQSPSWKANRSSASQQIPCILWNPKVHYFIYKSLPPLPILSSYYEITLIIIQGLFFIVSLSMAAVMDFCIWSLHLSCIFENISVYRMKLLACNIKSFSSKIALQFLQRKQTSLLALFFC